MTIIRCWTGDIWTADDYEAARAMIIDAAELYIEDDTDVIKWYCNDTRAVIWSEGESTGYWWEIES